MDDLISRQAAIDALNEVSEHYTDKGREWHPHVDFMVQVIEDLPSIEVVRCGECEYWKCNPNTGEYGVCKKVSYDDFEVVMDCDDFCSYGIRRNGGMKMRIVNIDDVIDALSSEYNNGTRNGIDYDQTDAAAFEELLEQVYEEKGWTMDVEPVKLKNEVARLNSALRDIDRDNARLHNQYAELEKRFNYLIYRIMERINTEG